MAEFEQVMRQWRRFCKSHNHCGECEFDGKGICGEAHMSEVPFADIELRIMAWAAEHPEHVYPTWTEWLIENGLLFACDSPYLKPWFVINQNRIGKPIPADIAQKLGIEPKEGNA